MWCEKKRIRTIFDMFKEYTCEGCKFNTYIDRIKIGRSLINIYYRGSCKLKYEKSIMIKRTKLLFKDITMDSLNKRSNNIFLWFDINDNLSNYYEDLEGFINSGYNIHIIV